MNATKAIARPVSNLQRLSRQRRTFAYRSTSKYALRRQQHFTRSITVVAVVGATVGAYQWYTSNNGIVPKAHAEAPAPPPSSSDTPPIVFEQSRKRPGASKDETRKQISSQHLQVQKSWENPGVYTWGANDGKVVAPEDKATMIRNPRWSTYFNGKLLRDMKLARDFGAAIDEKGDLLQWGTAFSTTTSTPTVTLKGKDLKSLVLSRDRILALSSNGKVYSLSVSYEEQQTGPKVTESSWIPFWSNTATISYRLVGPSTNERISSIAGGLEHILLLTSSGRVYSAASGSADFPTKGQLGIPGLTWFSKPAGPYDQPHEVKALHDFKIKQVAAGDYHSVALDRQGRVFSWGDNQRGQLGIGETGKETTFFDHPTLMPITKLYQGTQQKPEVTAIFAGGNTTFLTIDATRVAQPDASDAREALRGVGRITADTWACGHGIWGQLGNGRWTHVQSLPTKIQPLSGLYEYDELTRKTVPIRIRDIAVGDRHVAATLDNVTYVSASSSTSENDTNWGADVLWFGNNEFYQLGTGKRNNVVNPTYIKPLDRVAEVMEGGRPKGEEHRFHVTPKAMVKLGGRWVGFEQKVVCGRGVSAVYSRVC